MKHVLTKKISVEFLNLYDENLFTLRDEREVEKYVARVTVTAGDPAEVYFMEGERQLPLAYF